MNNPLENLSKDFILNPTEGCATNILVYCRNNGIYSLGKMLGEKLKNLFPNSYSILDEYAICLYWTNEIEKCNEIYEKLLTFPNLTDTQVKHIMYNLQFCVEKIRHRYTFYNEEIVKKLKNKPKNPNPFISLSMTSCKRFDLFQKTMNSFLNCCEDVEKIDEWFVVDDNSSEEDRKKMIELYPFVNFYFKTISEKGHPQSMNIILKHISSPYLFHMEDDFQFYIRKPFLSDCLSVLGNNSTIGQCLINRIYSETQFDPFRIEGGKRYNTPNGIRYLIHEYAPQGSKEWEEFRKNHGNCINESYWPHFSFRPGLNNLNIWRKIGEFNEKISHFEMDYAYKYVNLGYTTAFFDTISCLHIGRLTSERNNVNKKNAYELNDEAQFFGKEEKIKKEILELTPSKTFIVNLDRRTDRWEKFVKEEKNKIDFLNPIRFSAIDGKKLTPSVKLLSLFFGNDYNYRRGMIGCALSHITLWLQLLREEKVNNYIILEDDVSVAPNFKNKFSEFLENIPENGELIYLGASMRPNYLQTNNVFDLSKKISFERWNMSQSLANSLGGTIGYMITKKGAEKMLIFLEKVRMTNCIDTMMQKNMDNIVACYPNVHLLRSEIYGNESVGGNLQVDTDIGNNYDNLGNMPEKEKLDMIKKFLGGEPNVLIGEKMEENEKVEDGVLIFTRNNELIKKLWKQLKNSFPVENIGIAIKNEKLFENIIQN